MKKIPKTAIFNFDCQARADIENDEMILTGYPVVIDKVADMYFFDEIITREGLENADISDVVLNKQHDDRFVVARTSNGTLSLEKDDKGLKMIARLSRNNSAKELYEDVSTGLYDKMSFRAEFLDAEVDESAEKPVVRVTNLGRIFDVSVVAHPAYSETEVSARAELFNIKEREELDMKNKAKEPIKKREEEIDIEPIEGEGEDNKVLDAVNKIDKNLNDFKAEVKTNFEGLSKRVSALEGNPNDDGGEEGMRVLEGNQVVAGSKKYTKQYIEKVRFFAALGNRVAERMVEDKTFQARATAHGVDNLLDNHSEGSAVELVDEVAFKTIMEQMKDLSPVLQHVNTTNIKGTVKFFYEKEGSDGAVWLEDAEEGKGEKLEVAFTKVTADRLQKLVYASDELRETAIEDFEAFIYREVAREMAYALEIAVFNGDGKGKPLGILQDTRLTSIEVPADAKIKDVFVAGLPLLPSFYRQNAKIYMNTKDYFASYVFAEDSAGNPVDYSKKLGSIEVVGTDNVPEGTVIIGDFKEYMLNLAKKMEFAYSDEFLFSQNVRAYRAYTLAGGKVRMNKAFAIIKKKAGSTPK